MLRHLTLRLAKHDDSERATAVTLPHKHDDSARAAPIPQPSPHLTSQTSTRGAYTNDTLKRVRKANNTTKIGKERTLDATTTSELAIPITGSSSKISNIERAREARIR
jgi:hypothetical protein